MRTHVHAESIRGAAQALRDSIAAARDAGFEVVQIPNKLIMWLQTGNPPGEPATWTIKRKSGA